MMKTAKKHFISAWRALAIVVFAASALVSSAVAQDSNLPEPSTSVPAAQPALAPVIAGEPVFADENYQLGTGDKLKITVYGEDDLSGEFLVDGSGQVQLPLVGQARAAGLTIHQFVDEVTSMLGAKYLRNPRVSVQIENYRPFYIIGEVNKPGAYPYQNALSALGAVALAGGYTYRADDHDVYIRRSGGTMEEKLPANATTRVYPGDIVRIAERFF